MLFRILLVALWTSTHAAWAEYEEYSPENNVALEAFQAGDQALAYEIWQRLAEGGDARALSNMGMLYQNGVVVEQDSPRGAEFFRRSAMMDFEVGQYNLGVVYRDGDGIVQDYAAAFGWFRLAAFQGYPKAQGSMITAYMWGRGTQANPARAYMWLLLMIDTGNEEAVGLREDIEAALTPDEIAQGQEWAKLCDLADPIHCG